MSRHLDDRVVVVTGASSGIGRACARRFAAAGATLVLLARRENALETLATECRGRGAQVLVTPLDVTDADAMADAARQAVARFGRIDVWVNNAGVNLFGPVEESPAPLWHQVVQTNLFGTYHGIRAVLPWFRDQGHGTLINVSSVAGWVPAPQQSAYVASKHAVRALSDCTRQEVRDVPGIAVCTVVAGPVDTPLLRNAANWTGRRVVPPTRPRDADQVAQAVGRLIRRPRREVYVGAGARLGVLAARLLPARTERASARTVPRTHFAHEAVDHTGGNVRCPEPPGARVTGGRQPALAHGSGRGAR
ncbi:SDR family NAD(P)-dependent oxidoreductase [Micromonospora sp. NBC_01813]|uniref:SDR family NAD(P)-dependent oxidoreductase n=1 Tax=Micromonospora sp. NBC_01813 TaxID=2975988 RepID=UPI002DDAC3F0|nr:SDR family NAD(P)-dependent oxidoreductase [Micromonospora sp. NBC_01813]WSA09848.1 SDR family NAD(P)-dependent oxidoreductase [Micromonospora sp. NBC_01813]